MTKDGDETPEKTPAKEQTLTPPRMPSLPPRNASPKKETATNLAELKPQGFDFRTALKNAVDSDGVSENITKPKHERGVSWDQNVAIKERVSPKPPRPATEVGVAGVPSLMNKVGNGPLPPRPPAMTRRGISTGSTATGFSRRNILESIPDDPYEREAEDVLLLALEERDPMHVRTNTGANILPGVPVDVIRHDFSVESEEKPSSGDLAAPPSPKSRPRMTSREPSMFNRGRIMSTDQSTGSRGRPNIPKPTHKRQLTVEEALFGLTAALSAVHHEERKAGHLPPEPSGRERSDTVSSKDKLGKTADLVFGRRFMSRRSSGFSDSQTSLSVDTDTNGKNQVSSQETTAATANTVPNRSNVAAKARWGLLKQNLDVYKKDDDIVENNDDDLEGADIEVGDEDNIESSNRVDGPQISDDHDVGDTHEEKKANKKAKRRKRKGTGFSPFKHLPYADKIKKEWDMFSSFMAPKKATMSTYARYILLYLWFPCLTAASILYHFFENPPTGKGPFTDPTSPSGNTTTASESEPVERLTNQASISWWLIFICMRQVGILVISKSIQIIIVDFLAIQTRAILRSFGPVITLLFVQSKGWPFMLSCWGLLNFLLVIGDSEFNRHWLYWQDVWGLFNDNNPAGDVTNTLWFKRICAIASALGFAVGAKRVIVGIYLGRQTFANYSDKLAHIMNKMLQVSQVAILSQAIERKYWAEMDRFNVEDSAYNPQSQRDFSRDNLLTLIEDANDELPEHVSMIDYANKSQMTGEGLGKVIDTDDVNPFTGGLGEAQKARIADLLGGWEEPGRGHLKCDYISVGAVLQFRRALASMDTPYPFSGSFGLAETRENCIASAQSVYERLLLKNQTVNGKLHFDTLAVLALQNGELDTEHAKELIRTFRPDRDGGISMVDFVRSIDAIYKELRMLRATVAASAKIDKALESIMNIVFYVTVTCIILAAYGFDPLALFLSLSSIILAFAFMIGSASAKYFEGLLFILIQRPYGIGDRINVSNPESETNGAGAQGWIVDDVTLFTTTMCMVGTNERATVSNGTLAKSRIINGARSNKAILVLTLKFGIDSPYGRIEIFKSAVEKFVKARPREWLALLGIRAGKIQAELGFVEYSVVVQHREAWQNAGKILDSKHSIHCFMLELTKKLELNYKQPPLPVLLSHGFKGPLSTIDANYDFEQNLSMKDRGAPLSPRSVGTSSSDDVQAVISMFDGK